MFKKINKKSKKTTEVIDLDINEALSIKERLKNITVGDDIKVSKQDEEFFHMAADLIGTLVSIFGMWRNSKKKNK